MYNTPIPNSFFYLLNHCCFVWQPKIGFLIQSFQKPLSSTVRAVDRFSDFYPTRFWSRRVGLSRSTTTFLSWLYTVLNRYRLLRIIPFTVPCAFQDGAGNCGEDSCLSPFTTTNTANSHYSGPNPRYSHFVSTFAEKNGPVHNSEISVISRCPQGELTVYWLH